LSLLTITWGSILVAIDVNGERKQIIFDDIDDNLVIFARFVELLADGGQPHAALADHASSHFVVRNRPELNLCELRMSLAQNDGQDHVLINVLTERHKLAEEFRRLAKAIAEHPNLGHHFLCHIDLSDNDYERVHTAAESEWYRKLKQAHLPDDSETESAFCASKLVAGIPLSSDQAELTGRYRIMLQNLEIPNDWRRHYGLAQIER
jgi:hypothetical protein